MVDVNVVHMRLNTIVRRAEELTRDLNEQGIDTRVDDVASIVSHLESTFKELRSALVSAKAQAPPPLPVAAKKRKRDAFDDEFDV